MPLRLSQREHPRLFSSVHYHGCPLPDDRLEIMVSGIAAVDFRGTAGADWYRDTVTLSVDLGSAIDLLTSEKKPRAGHVWGFHADHWVALVTLSSISNASAGVNAGWAVDAFRVAGEDEGAREVRLLADLAVSDVDGVIHRIGYQLTLVGHIKEIKAT